MVRMRRTGFFLAMGLTHHVKSAHSGHCRQHLAERSTWPETFNRRPSANRRRAQTRPTRPHAHRKVNFVFCPSAPALGLPHTGLLFGGSPRDTLEFPPAPPPSELLDPPTPPHPTGLLCPRVCRPERTCTETSSPCPPQASPNATRAIGMRAQTHRCKGLAPLSGRDARQSLRLPLDCLRCAQRCGSGCNQPGARSLGNLQRHLVILRLQQELDLALEVHIRLFCAVGIEHLAPTSEPSDNQSLPGCPGRRPDHRRHRRTVVAVLTRGIAHGDPRATMYAKHMAVYDQTHGCIPAWSNAVCEASTTVGAVRSATPRQSGNLVPRLERIHRLDELLCRIGLNHWFLAFREYIFGQRPLPISRGLGTQWFALDIASAATHDDKRITLRPESLGLGGGT